MKVVRLTARLITKPKRAEASSKSHNCHRPLWSDFKPLGSRTTVSDHRWFSRIQSISCSYETGPDTRAISLLHVIRPTGERNGRCITCTSKDYLVCSNFSSTTRAKVASAVVWHQSGSRLKSLQALAKVQIIKALLLYPTSDPGITHQSPSYNGLRGSVVPRLLPLQGVGELD